MVAVRSNTIGLTLCCSRSVDTVINISHNEDSAFSVLHIKTLDRPGLLVEIVKVLKDINVNVISAEVRPCIACCPACAAFAMRTLLPHDCTSRAGGRMPFALCWTCLRAQKCHLAALAAPALVAEGAVNNVNCLGHVQVDTEGRIASDSFFVTYHGEPLNQSMVQLVTNALQVVPASAADAVALQTRSLIVKQPA